MPETNPEEDYVVYSVNGMRGDIDIIPLINEQIELAMNRAVLSVNGIGPDINGNVQLDISGGGGNIPIGGGGGGGGIHSLQRHGKRMKIWHEYVKVDQYGDWEAIYKPANFEEIIAVFAHGSELTEEPQRHSAKGRTHAFYNDKVKVTVLGF